MTTSPDITAKLEADYQRLKRYNPFVVGLDDQGDAQRHNIQLYDGRNRLIPLPIAEFDGYPLKGEYFYFIPAVVLVVFGTLLPLFPLLFPWMAVGLIALFAVAYILTAIILSTVIAFLLTNIRTAYIAANRDIRAGSFVTKARGIRSLIHTFKRIVRWRRFMRYTMNIGYAGLVITAAVGFYFYLHPLGEYTARSLAGFAALFFLCAASLITFELGRISYTPGMDPTLALVMMIEEIGAQLLVARQPQIMDMHSGEAR